MEQVTSLSSALETVCPMWKMFHNPIITLFKDLNNATNDLDNLLTTFLNFQNSFTDIFIPRYGSNLNLNAQDSRVLDEKYFSFAMWFQGRLFYLLSCRKLKRIHDLAIKAQLKILNLVSVYPNFYTKMCQEYVAIVRQLLSNVCDTENGSPEIVLIQFLTQPVCIMEDFELTPLFVTASNTNGLPLLSDTIHILVEALNHEIDLSFRSAFVRDTWTTLLEILCTADVTFKAQVINCYAEMLKGRLSKGLGNSSIDSHFLSFLSLLKSVVYQVNDCDENLGMTLLNPTLIKAINIIGECDAPQDNEIAVVIVSVCQFILTHQNFDLTLKQASARCVQNIIPSNLSGDLVTTIAFDNILFFCDSTINPAFEVQIKYDITSYCKRSTIGEKSQVLVKVYEVSQTCRIISDTVEKYVDMYISVQDINKLKSVNTILMYIRTLHIDLKTVYNENGDKKFLYLSNSIVSTILNKFLTVLRTASEVNIETLMLLIEIFHSFLWLDNFQLAENSVLNRSLFDSMMCCFMIPFVNEIQWKFSDTVLATNLRRISRHMQIDENSKQTLLFTITSAIVQCANYQEMHGLICMVFRYFVWNSESEPKVLNVVLNCIPLIVACGVSEGQLAVTNWVLPLLKSDRNDILVNISEMLSQFVRLYSNDCGIYCVYTRSAAIDIQFKYQINPRQELQMQLRSQVFESGDRCWLVREVRNTNVEPQISYLRDLFSPFMQLLDCKYAPQIICNILDVLSALTFRTSAFNTLDYTKKWMPLINHNDYSIRQKLASVFRVLIQNLQAQENRTQIFEYCQLEIVNAAKECIQSAKFKFQETVATTVRELGCLEIENSALLSLKLLIHFVGNIRSNIAEFACICIQDLVEYLGTTEERLYIKYKKDICRTIVDLCVLNSTLSNVKFSAPLHKLLIKFGFVDANDFIARDGRYLLPYLIPWLVKLPKTGALLNYIADRASSEVPELLINQFGNIYPHIYLNESPDMYKQCICYIQKISRQSEVDLKCKHFRVIHNELLLYYHEHPEKIEQGLKALFKDYDAQISNTVNLVTLLQPRLLGVLVYFDSRFVSKRVAHSIKRKALRSLPDIIQLMGAEHITPLRFKVLATLHTTLTLDSHEFRALSCTAWEAFVRNCDIAAIGPLLSTIFISLMPLQTTFPDVIDSIFKFLIIEHNKELAQFLPDLFFLTETNVCEEIKQVIRKLMSQQASASFREQLQFYLRYLNHENVEVRVHAVRFVTLLMKNNRDHLNELILGNDGLDPVIVQVLELLMAGMKDNVEKLQLACSSCIGEIGAIEPSHLPQRYTKLDNSFPFAINDEVCVINAFTELIRAFQSEKYTQNMDCFAVAIQEMLRLHQISPNKRGSLWAKFPVQHQQIMQPLLSSRYKIAGHAEKRTCHPIFGSEEIKSHKDWIHNWTSKLIHLIKNETTRKLFEVCRPSLRKDNRLLLFFLPYLVTHALIDSSDGDGDCVYEEMVTVLTAYKQDSNAVNKKPLKSDLLRYVPSVPTFEQITLNEASKTVYLLLDFLIRWQREWENAYFPTQSPQNNYDVIKHFLKKFCKLMVAQSNYNCDEYFRSLMYLEDYVSEHPQELENQLGFFTRIYVQLEDPDGVSGVRAIQQSEPSLEEMILGHEIAGQLQDAAACYERLAQEKNLEPHILQGLIRCYLDLDNPFTACRITEGLVRKRPEYSNVLHECEVETLWRLGQFDNLKHLLARPELKKNNSWGVRLGHILMHFRNGQNQPFFDELAMTRNGLIGHFSYSNREQGLYENGYSQIMKLHILNELQKIQEMVQKIISSKNGDRECEILVERLVRELDQRQQVVQSNVRVLEPMLSLRRIALQQTQHLLSTYRSDLIGLFDKHIGNYWLRSAQVARSVGLHQQAYIYLLNAERYKPVGLFVERAKLHWARSEQEIAFNILKRGIEEQTQNTSQRSDSTYHKKLLAEAKLLVASYNEETANLDAEANIAKYKEAIDSNKECEISMVYLARYYDKAHATMVADKDVGLGGDMQLHIINYFGKSLQYGTEFIYQSMPRMLSIWVEYGSRQLETQSKDVNYEAKCFNVLKMTKLISTYLERLPPYIFFSAFSQIVSRICHQHKMIYNELKSIIVKLILSYPQQSLWMLLPVLKSGYLVRMKRCQEILVDERVKGVPGLLNLFNDYNRLAERLIELCNKELTGVATTTVSVLVRALPRLFAHKEFSQIMMPVQQFRKMILPSDAAAPTNHNAFPRKLVYISGILETVTVMQSGQKPKRVSLLGSDGQPYTIMLKPKDDLRKDFRFMEFNDVVNHYLHLEPESRQRRLYIRTYSVVPLNEQCGIIEWVHHQVVIRAIAMKIYKQKGIYVTPKELKTLISNLRDPLSVKRQIYLESLLPRFPPVFHEWFRHTFPDPHSWYQARTAYIRTAAVMSIVGYILGLGDRHGENILFDSTNGDTLHVDFNCLFNKGETLEWAERVPFRLTPNMVKAMGPLGVEGTFRRCCEITLRVLRKQKDTLMSIVKPFVYDPLVTWHKKSSSHIDPNSERTNEQARDHVKNIESRLQGMKGGAKLSICLSVEGHVNSLIVDATSIDNLCQMYVGWGAYL